MSARDEWSLSRDVHDAFAFNKARGSGRTLQTINAAIQQAEAGEQVILVGGGGHTCARIVDRITQLTGEQPQGLYRFCKFPIGEGGSLEVMNFNGEKSVHEMLLGHTGKRVFLDHAVLEMMVVEYARGLCSQWCSQ